MYYVHKKYSLSKQKTNEINGLFNQYDIAEIGRISPRDARELLRTIGIDGNRIADMAQKSDPENRGSIRLAPLLENIRIYLAEEQMDDEITNIFDLVCEMGASAYDDEDLQDRDEVPIEYIRRAAVSLGEYFTESELKEMIEMVDPTNSGTLTLQNFMKTMNKTRANSIIYLRFFHINPSGDDTFPSLSSGDETSTTSLLSAGDSSTALALVFLNSKTVYPNHKQAFY
ncbi:hypothetical protein HDV01_004553 [Terramyces sp. JEL0728]|nr:hypothetical protein HDV01_004553 [Terramyces sp. JEL0728]